MSPFFYNDYLHQVVGRTEREVSTCAIPIWRHCSPGPTELIYGIDHFCPVSNPYRGFPDVATTQMMERMYSEQEAAWTR
jgi:hypothetical protein